MERTAFLVDDEPDLLDEVGEFLEECGYSVVTAANGQKMLERLHNRVEPFVLLTDLHMPGLSGIELVQELLRTQGPPKRFKTILFSGAGDMGLAIAALKVGVMDFLLKPLDLEKLSSAVERAFGVLDEEASAANAGAHLRREVERLAVAFAKVGDLASEIERAGFASPSSPPAPDPARPAPAASEDQILLEVIKSEQTLRSRRNKLLPSGAGADPIWEMLLFLMEQQLLSRQVSVTSACHACSVPATTALRKLDEMTDEGLLEREPDPGDKRRILVRLTASGVGRVKQYLDAAVRVYRRSPS